MNQRVLILLVITAAVVSAAPIDDYEHEAMCKNAPGLWDNWFANLDALFWRPWLDQYRVIRYAAAVATPLGMRTQWDENTMISKSCLELGLTDWRSVVLIHWMAWAPSPQFGPWSFLVQNTPLATQRALEALRHCSSTTFASRKDVLQSLNSTLQKQGRCGFATKTLRCAIGNLYWILSYAAIGLIVLGLVLTVVMIAGLCCCFSIFRSGEGAEEEISIQ